jgi:hypothetical protein
MCDEKTGYPVGCRESSASRGAMGDPRNLPGMLIADTSIHGLFL